MTSHTDTIPVARSKAKDAPGRRKTGRGRGSVSPLMGLSHLALVVWALLVIIPIGWTLLASIKTNDEIFGDPWTLPHHWVFGNWGTAWTQAHMGRYMINTVFVVGVSTFFTMLLG